MVVHLKSYPPRTGELFYLRAILQHHGGRSWADLHTIDGIYYDTFQAAAIALRLFPERGEAHYAMAEAVAELYSPAQLRFLFASILIDMPADSLKLYADFLDDMSWDLKVHDADEPWPDVMLRVIQRYLQA